MKKILFCTLNSKYIHSSLAPWYLCSAVEELSCGDYDVDVLEATVNEPIEKVTARIVAQRPDFIGFSVYIWNRTSTFEIIERVKAQLPSAKIVVGGPEVAYDIKATMRHTELDYVISGEGEWPVSLLVDKLFGEESIGDIAGVSYRKANGEIHIAEPYISECDPPNPYTEKYLSSLNGRIAYLETSRGCPYNCAYCLSGRCGGVRFFDIDEAKANMLLLANSGTRTVKLVDRTFNADKNRACELFLFIIERYGKEIPDTVCFHFEISADILDEETIEILHSAPVGAIQLEIGIQSYNNECLADINRKSDLDRLDENIRKILEVDNIHVHIDLIAGLPREDIESFSRGFDRAYGLGADMLQLGFLKLLHGSEMREKKESFVSEFSESPPYEVSSTPWLTQGDLEILHSIEDSLERLSNSARFSRTLKYIFEDAGYTPYEFFKEFGAYSKADCENRASLEKYTDTLYTFLADKKGLDKLVVRDCMILDRMENCSTGYVPLSLRIEDKALSMAKKALDRLDGHKSKRGVKRMVAILYSMRKVAYVDYEQESVTCDKYRRYIVNMLDYDELLKK